MLSLFQRRVLMPGESESYIILMRSARRGFSTGKRVDRISLYMFTVSSRFPV